MIITYETNSTRHFVPTHGEVRRILACILYFGIQTRYLVLVFCESAILVCVSTFLHCISGVFYAIYSTPR